jgi:hypothetical protein
MFQQQMAALAARQQQELVDARRAVEDSLGKQQQQQLAQDLAAKEVCTQDAQCARLGDSLAFLHFLPFMPITDR